jgi:hypothetical protein
MRIERDMITSVSSGGSKHSRKKPWGQPKQNTRVTYKIMAASAKGAEAVVRALGAALLATPANVASLLMYGRNQLHRPATGVPLLQLRADTRVGADPTALDLFKLGVAHLFPAHLVRVTVLAQNNAVPLKTDRVPRVFSLLSLTFVITRLGVGCV